MNAKKILIVDDDAVIRRRLMLTLKNSGYEILIAADGSEAVSVARQKKPDLILLDITFPPDVAHGGGVPWDGFLIMDWLHRIDEAKSIPIIVVTGSPPEKFKDRAMAKGAVSFFQKPIDSDQLLTEVRRVLGDAAPPTPPAPAPAS